MVPRGDTSRRVDTLGPSTFEPSAGGSVVREAEDRPAAFAAAIRGPRGRPRAFGSARSHHPCRCRRAAREVPEPDAGLAARGLRMLVRVQERCRRPASSATQPTSRLSEHLRVTTVLLVRHGLTALTGPVLAGRTPGVDLDERGRAQAAAVAQRLAGVALQAIVSSPLDRCRQTAEVIAGDRPVDADPRTHRVWVRRLDRARDQEARQGSAVEGRAGTSERGDVSR